MDHGGGSAGPAHGRAGGNGRAESLVEPNAGNVVPGGQVSLDVRHAHDATRQPPSKNSLTLPTQSPSGAGSRFERTGRLDQPAVPMDERLTSFLADAIEAAGCPLKHMPSGAGHDAMVMAARVPTAMLFLRSPGGISHHPAESVLEEDVEAALRSAANFLRLHLAATLDSLKSSNAISSEVSTCTTWDQHEAA